MEWLDKIEFEDLLDGDLKLVYELCGKEVLFLLWKNLAGINIYISTRPLMEARKRFIKKAYTGDNVKQLALMLDVSERFVQDVISRKDIDDAQLRMME